MIDDIFVIDATTHTYNLSDANLLGPAGRPGRHAIVFRNDELAKRWPQRFLTYAGVNPVDGPDACVASLTDQLDRLPGTIGLKVYPDAGTPDRSWRMDDPAYAPLFELAIERGLKVVACHKVVPNGLVPLEPYRIDDLERAAISYPQLSFEIVHAGLPPFVDEVTMALTRLPNVYANLEITSAFLERGFGVVEEALAAFIGFAGVHKLVYASGGMHFHPQPIIERLLGWEISDELLNRYRIEPLTAADRAAILGGNFARMAGLDVDELRNGIADDEFAQARRDGGRRPAWTHWRELVPESVTA